MPLYEFDCEDHGLFDEMRSFDLSSAPAKCPVCGKECQRVLSVPRTRVLDRSTRIGMERNEKSRHEPRKHVCHAGCNHGKPQKPKSKGYQPYTGSRPWVVEHG